MLQVSDLTMKFGGVTAIDAVSFSAFSGKITAVIGPNGAGKTTLFNCLTGFYIPTSGHMRIINDRGTAQLAGLPAHTIARMGLARTFQNIRLFSNMTVLENLLVAQHTQLMPHSMLGFGALFGLPRYRKAEQEAIERARFWLDQLMLLKAADRVAGELPYGMQRRVEIARSMCTAPRFLCLDEPAAGLNSSESERLQQAIARIRDEHGVGILLVEHNMNLVMGISDQIVVLDYGKKIAEGEPAAIRSNPAVIRAYLGEEEEVA